MITNCLHQPPPHDQIEILVNDLCQYANNSLGQSPIHTAAFLLWRMNWIHPFSGGNGRTARAMSYLVLCIRLGYVLPGANTIPAQIEANRPIYYCGLHYADALLEVGVPSVSGMERVLAMMLNNQLGGIFQSAVAAPPPAAIPPVSPPAPPAVSATTPSAPPAP
jgi:hypothetical protein